MLYRTDRRTIIYIALEEPILLVSEYHIHPVVRALETVRRKLAARSVHVQPVSRSCPAIHQRLQRRVVHSCNRKVVPVQRKISRRTEVRRHIHRVRRNRHRTRKIRLLPTGGGLSRERRRPQQRPRAAPKVSGMCPGVVHSLVEPYPRNKSAAARREPHSQL